MFTFDPKEHIYRVNGRGLPSSTQILDEWMEVSIYGEKYFVNRYTKTVISYDRFRKAQDHGRGLHKACKLISENNLNWKLLHKSYLHSCRQFEKWIFDYKIVFLIVERPFYSRKYLFAGTPDIFCLSRDMGDIVLVVDIKSGEYLMVGPQLASYEVLYRENEKWKGKMKRYVLSLPKNKNYKFEELKNKHDWGFFQSKLYQQRFMKGVLNVK